MKKYILILFLLFSCKSIEEQTIGYNEIVSSAWESFIAQDYLEARTGFNNALTYDILDNVAEAHVGLGWTNLYIANLLTDLEDTDQRNLERDQAYNDFITAEITNIEKINNGFNSIDQLVEAILTAGLVFIYDYRLLKYNFLYFNCDEIYCNDNELCECGNNENISGEEINPEQFRYHHIIPTAIKILNESNLLIDEFPPFSFPYDPNINMDDIHFIRANLAFQFDDFSSTEFEADTTFNNDEIIYAAQEICDIIELTDKCLELGFEEYCIPEFPNIPVEDLLACLSSFHTSVNGIGNE